MKTDSKKSLIIKLIIFAVVCGAAIGIGTGTGLFGSVKNVFQDINLNGKSLLSIVIMASMVLAATYLICLILGLFSPKSHRARTVISIVTSLIKYISAIVIICWGLTILGADVGTVVAGVGLSALIVGFSAESLISDMITGIFMIFENQYNVGDFIEVGGFRGKVTSIGVRTTCLEDAGGNIKIVNNSDMKNILNRSDHSSRAVSTIGIPYETDLEALEEKIPAMMTDIFEKHNDIMLSEPVYLGVDALADSSVNLKFVVEVEDKNIFSGSRVLNREIWLGMRKAGVEVPFPQVDVHQK